MMSCTQFEIAFSEYLDGTLPAAERLELEQHMATCAGCRVLGEEIAAAVRILNQADEVEVPADLITRIAYQAPRGRMRDPLDSPGTVSRWLTKWLQPLLQPRLVMGMAMTVLSFAMLERCTGMKVQHLQAADLNPVRVWGGVENKTLRMRDRAVKYYENLRWVYEIEVRLRAIQDQQAADATAEPVSEKKPATPGTVNPQPGSNGNGEMK